MHLQGERLIAAPIERVWEALNHPVTLQACIPGCESLQRVGENAFESVVAAKVGPVSARFKGKVELTDVTPRDGYTINFEGQGGMAGFAKGGAIVKLVSVGGKTRLAYTAEAKIGGKLAQIGSRLVDMAASRIAEEFFSALEQNLGLAEDGRKLVPE